MSRPMNVLALKKPTERYVFMWDDDEASKPALLRNLGVFAADKDLSFTWYDAAVLAQRVRKGEHDARSCQ